MGLAKTEALKAWRSQELVLASNNAGKLSEFARLFAPLHITVRAQSEFAVEEADEPYATFLENALAKARHAARCTQRAALADDSGLCVAALGGAPGVHSARFAGVPRSDSRNNQALVAALAGQADRRAHYVCVLVLVRHAQDPEPLVASGRLAGQIVDLAQGSAGFGYDAHMFLPRLGQTVAQLSAQQKDRISHRARAMRRLVAQLHAGDEGLHCARH